MLRTPALLALLFALTHATGAFAAEGSALVEESVKGHEAEFHVRLDEELSEVKVIQQKPLEKAGNVKIRILRKNQKPLEVKLHLLENKQDQFTYAGKASAWKGNLVGFELDFSFDKKTWKKLKKLLP